MCSCNVQKFQDEGNEYVKKLLHFHFHCQDCFFFMFTPGKNIPLSLQGFQKWTSVQILVFKKFVIFVFKLDTC